MNNELYHHGILGMKWGIRRFQNPDGTRTKAGKERYNLRSKKLDKQENSDYSEKKGLTEEQKKKLIKVGLIVVGTGLAAYGAYQLNKLGAFDNIIQSGKRLVSDVAGEAPKTGKSIRQIDKALVKSINEKFRGTPEGSVNCFHTSSSYILNSLFGIKCTAKGFNGIDEMSGAKLDGRDVNLFHSIFDGINEIRCNENASFLDSAKKIPPGSTGVLMIHNLFIHHFVNYEKTVNGKLTIVDAQSNLVWPAFLFNGSFTVSHILDFSNASIKGTADAILENIVEFSKGA